MVCCKKCLYLRKNQINLKKVKEFHENQIAQFLIEAHTIGSIRHKADFDNIVFHCAQTLNFTKQLISEVDGTTKEKLEFIEKVKKDFYKFKVKD